MHIDVLTLFPEFFEKFIESSIIGRACRNGLLQVNPINIRDFSKDKHKKADDYPYGGGSGMVMMAQPIYDAYNSITNKENSKVIFFTPQGKKFNQRIAIEYKEESHLILLCGHYEGVDERIIETIVDHEISMGDYILTGGEIPAMAFIDCVSRLIPGVLSNQQSHLEESHYNGLLEYPQYTRPKDFMGRHVPEVLLSGNHAKIAKWQKEQSINRTRERRPDILKNEWIKQLLK